MKQRPWMRPLLAGVLLVSLVMNFFLLGFVLKDRWGARGTNILVEGVAASYSEDIRREFRRVLGENRQRTAAAIQDLRTARRELAATAGKSPFDEAEVKRAMAKVRTSTDALQALLQDFLLEALRRARHSA
ncbi:putative membrane protein [Chelatococcus asaccharovorans]|uniref:Putative membrane protein n=2 Tax=Chelatococcus asaccharovorans TaxID=28210 RepID=A0A2V3TU16_9HYPH|nr:periplasmic heavy metal sensor [Chelatococcus asaccharovorans]PXW51926.1 putative membrane protein [Chelatococcus asaccharovorans]